MKTLLETATEVGNLLEEKNKAYGNAFDTAGDFLRLLYPQGVQPNQYNDMLCLVRIFDKMKRIATGDPTENSWQDISGYGILGLKRHDNDKFLTKLKEQEDKYKKLAEEKDTTSRQGSADELKLEVGWRDSMRVYPDGTTGL